MAELTDWSVLSYWGVSTPRYPQALIRAAARDVRQATEEDVDSTDCAKNYAATLSQTLLHAVTEIGYRVSTGSVHPQMNRAIGDLAEVVVAPEFVRKCWGLETVSLCYRFRGIDTVLVDEYGNPVVCEVKSTTRNAPRLARTRIGRQMSAAWRMTRGNGVGLPGEVTGGGETVFVVVNYATGTVSGRYESVDDFGDLLVRKGLVLFNELIA